MSPVEERCRSTSFALTTAQLEWLDAKRQHGAISRSAALRQALDHLMAAGLTEWSCAQQEP
jgi:hypothetical protein